MWYVMEVRGTEFLTVGGRLVSLARPLVMGIINVTPDSFYAGSRRSSASEALEQAGRMLREGADILDIGACSTRPGSAAPSPEEEWKRLEDTLKAVRDAFPEAILSVDTFRTDVARRCVEEYGVQIINDISGGTDAGMFELVAETGAVYVLTHSRGDAASMQSLTDYEDVTAEVLSDLAFRLDTLRSMGACNVMVDPGFGFAKTLDQNYQMMAGLEAFKALEAPLLVGVSRKSMVSRVLGCTAGESLAGSLALAAVALMKGADILRVHDVKATSDVVKIIERL